MKLIEDDFLKNISLNVDIINFTTIDNLDFFVRISN